MQPYIYDEFYLLGYQIMNTSNCSPMVTNKQPFWNHLSSTTLLTHRAVSWQVLCLPRDLSECVEASAVLPINGHLRTFFWVTFYWLIELCLPANALSAGIPKWMCKAFLTVIDKWPLQDYLSSKTVLTHTALPQSRCSVSQETWMMNVHGQVSLSVTDEWPFQDHFLSKTIISTWSALSPGRFPSVTEEQHFQDHLLSKTIMQTWSVTSLSLSLSVYIETYI